MRVYQPGKLIALQLDRAERQFLLYRLANVSSTAEAIVHRPRAHEHASPWDRRQVIERIVGLVELLRGDASRPVYVMGRIACALLREAIEGNRYFVDMPDGDPRFNAAAIRRADELRVKVYRAINERVGQVQLGEGRERKQPSPAPRRKLTLPALAAGAASAQPVGSMRG